MIYELLCQYLTDKNYNEDGSPSDDDDYYMIAKIQTDRSIDEIKKEIENTENISEHSEEIQKLFATEEYVEDSFRILQVLSTVGHKEKVDKL